MSAPVHHVIWTEDAGHPFSGAVSNCGSSSTGSSRKSATRLPPHHVLHVPRGQATALSNSYLQGYLQGVTLEFDSSGLSGSTRPDISQESPGSAELSGGRCGNGQWGAAKGAQLAPQYTVAEAEDGAEDDAGDDSDSEAGEATGGLVHSVLTASTPNDHMMMTRFLLKDELGEIAGLGTFWSKGAKRHGDGRCKPCHYVHVTGGCLNGASCGFCHLPHPKSKPRQCKSKRVHYKMFREIFERVYQETPERFLSAAGLAAQANPEIRSLLDSEQGAFGVTPTVVPGGAAAQGGNIAPRRHILSL
mmetsp:Transcript_54002/g.106597  ORF Transcript_54002/g.106597 Transcript_54002/m.106597 type:complete len:303 (+) Transcript_54002:85-993(+)